MGGSGTGVEQVGRSGTAPEWEWSRWEGLGLFPSGSGIGGRV